jgi:hypothetical protein
MSASLRLVCYVFLGALAAISSVVLVGTPSAEAQLGDIVDRPSNEPGQELVVVPGFADYCVGRRCEGRTCDEENQRCVGNVTLQPPMGAPLVGLSGPELNRFREGRGLFDKTFTAVDGLGPVFNQNSCGSCHNTPLGGSGTITVIRFGKIDVVDGEFVFDPLAELGGSLLNKESISTECAEIIPVPPTNVAAFRVTNSTLGFGLVEAIPDLDIEFNANNPPSGVSGRTHIVPVLEQPGTTKVGRFGWKAQLATVLSFTADASRQEMGIKFIDLTTDFQRFLAPPPQTPKSGMTGEAIFDSIGCADCHISSFQANEDDELEDAIRGKQANAYSDFLLHDMGNSGDFIEQGGAGLTELRTTPLWGLRVRDPLWHDGRVGGGTFDFRIINAVGNHDAAGSEAADSANAFFSLTFEERDAVIRFLDSLGRREFDMDGDGIVDDGDALIVDDCVAIGGPFSPDDLCAIADPDQSGFVDSDDLELLSVALGLVVPDDDESDDSDDDDDQGENQGDGGRGGILKPVAPQIPIGLQHFAQGSADEDPTESETAGQAGAEDRSGISRNRAGAGRRGQ